MQHGRFFRRARTASPVVLALFISFGGMGINCPLRSAKNVKPPHETPHLPEPSPGIPEPRPTPPAPSGELSVAGHEASTAADEDSDVKDVICFALDNFTDDGELILPDMDEFVSSVYEELAPAGSRPDLQGKAESAYGLLENLEEGDPAALADAVCLG